VRRELALSSVGTGRGEIFRWELTSRGLGRADFFGGVDFIGLQKVDFLGGKEQAAARGNCVVLGEVCEGTT
jgi:hypothetical protein